LRELRRWRLECGVPDDDEPIIGSFAVSALQQWGRRGSQATSGRTEGRTPYLLRHTHASLLHDCGYTVPSAAERMGDAASEHLSTYADVVKGLEGQPRHGGLGRADHRCPRRSGVPSRSETPPKW
jgi:integrase